MNPLCQYSLQQKEQSLLLRTATHSLRTLQSTISIAVGRPRDLSRLTRDEGLTIREGYCGPSGPTKYTGVGLSR